VTGLFLGNVDHLEGPVGKRGDMRWEMRWVADLTAAEQAALRTLSLAVTEISDG
jgi:hypothetical protein